MVRGKDERRTEMNDRDDYCYECTGYGDDYYTDDDGNLIRYCPECLHNPARDREEWDD